VNNPGYQPSCWESFGTSYFVQWEQSFYGVHWVTADPSATDSSYHTVAADESLPHFPMKAGKFRNSSRKIVLGDWNWNPNRHIDEPTTLWHHKYSKGVKDRQMNMLFGDGHAEDYTFPRWWDALSTSGNQPLLDPNGELW